MRPASSSACYITATLHAVWSLQTGALLRRSNRGGCGQGTRSSVAGSYQASVQIKRTARRQWKCGFDLSLKRSCATDSVTNIAPPVDLIAAERCQYRWHLGGHRLVSTIRLASRTVDCPRCQTRPCPSPISAEATGSKAGDLCRASKKLGDSPAPVVQRRKWFAP